jgi:hypothetical protein
MNKVTIAFIFAALLGGILIGLSVNELNHLTSPAPQNAATSTMTVDTLDPQFVLHDVYIPTSTFYIDLDQTSTPCFIASTQGICLPSFKDFVVDAQLLKAIRSGNFAISGNNISVPIGNGSSTDLTNVLNYIQSEITK